MGIWSGLVAASSTTTIAYLIALRLFNWDKIASEAVAAARAEHATPPPAVVVTSDVELVSLVRSDALAAPSDDAPRTCTEAPAID